MKNYNVKEFKIDFGRSSKDSSNNLLRVSSDDLKKLSEMYDRNKNIGFVMNLEPVGTTTFPGVNMIDEINKSFSENYDESVIEIQGDANIPDDVKDIIGNVAKQLGANSVKVMKVDVVNGKPIIKDKKPKIENDFVKKELEELTKKFKADVRELLKGTKEFLKTASEEDAENKAKETAKILADKYAEYLNTAKIIISGR